MMIGEGWIRVVPRKKSYIVDIIVEHTNPEITYIIANGILEASKKSVEDKINEETDVNVRMANQMVSGAEKEILNLENAFLSIIPVLKERPLLIRPKRRSLSLKSDMAPNGQP